MVSGHRITIPPVVRRRLDINIGDDVDIIIEKKAASKVEKTRIESV